MARSRAGNWFLLILITVGLLLAAIPGLWFYMKATAPRLHPNPAQIPSTSNVTSPSAAIEQARQVAKNSLSQQNLPGISIAVGRKNEILWAEGFGFADLDKKTPVTPQHRFRIGTASKPLTATAVAMLAEQGKLNLDDPIQGYVPEFPEKKWPVTIRQLLAQTSGLRNDGGDEGPLFTKHCEHPVEALSELANRSLLFEPGTRLSESSDGYILLSAAIEAVTKQPFLTFMRTQVFNPLEMRDTVPDPSRAVRPIPPIPNTVSFYFPRFASDPNYGLDPIRELDYSCYAGASVFLSTPSDLVRFALGVHRGKLLKPATVEMLQTSQRLASGEESGYGLGWQLGNVTLNDQRTRTAGHEGKILGGPVGSLLTFPEHDLAIAVLSNTSYADTYSLAVHIARMFAQK
jgi:CubicO group peptidase (beta-lactamase class C family)